MEAYLESALLSLLHQETKYHYEIIVINDGSKDGSIDILEKYRDDIIIIDKKNTGLSDSRNQGILKSKGKYLLFVDSDDMVSPHFVERMVSMMIETDSDMGICRFFHFAKEEELRMIPSYNSHVTVYQKGTYHTLFQLGFYVCMRIFKRELFSDFLFPKGKIYEDISLVPHLMMLCDKICLCDDILYFYRTNPNSITHSKTSKHKDMLDALNGIEDDMVQNGYQIEYEELWITSVLLGLFDRLFRSHQLNEVDIIYQDVLKRFPHWSRNPYLKNRSKKERIYLFLLRHHCYKTIMLIKR